MNALQAVVRRLDGPLIAAALATSGLKILSAGLNYALLILLARFMSVEGFGLYGLLFSAATLAAGFLSCGQPVLVLKSIPQYDASGDLPRQKGVIFFGAAVLAGTSGIFVLGMSVAYGLNLLPPSLGEMHLALVFGALTVIYAVSDYTCNLLRALGQTYQGLVPRDLIWRLIACGGVVVLAGSGGVGIFEVLVLLALSLALLVGWQLWRVYRIIRLRLLKPARYEITAWRAASVWMSLGSLLFVASLTVDTVIVGAVLGPEDAAVYFSAARTAAVSSLLLVGLRLIAAPVFAKLHYGAQPADLRSRVEMVYVLCTATAALFGLAGFLLAPTIMQVFGVEYAAGITPFRILLIGFAVATAGGMASSILEATGGERLNATILLVTQTATAAGIAIAALKVGLYGAAMVKASGIAIEAVLLSGCVFRRLSKQAVQGSAA